MNQSFKPLENPYQPMASKSTTPPEVKAHCEALWAIVGMFAFASVPIILGCYKLIEPRFAAATGQPRRMVCGLGRYDDAYALLFCAAPLCAGLGIILGGIAAKLWPKLQS